MAHAPTETESGNGREDWFQTTHWSVVLVAGRETSLKSAEALEQLCRAYWYPLYTYIRRRASDQVEAQDLTQEFFARMLAKQWLAQAEPARGKFRSFLLASLNHFLANEWHRSQRQKRGGGRPAISLDDTAEGRYLVQPSTEATPEKAYERQWALTLFDRALEQLRAEHARTGKDRQYELLKDYLWQQGNADEYQRAGEQLQLSHGAVSSAVHRLRQRYQQLVRQEIAHTVADPREVEEELRALMTALSSG